MLLFRLAHQESLQFAADYGDSDHNRIRAHGESADGLRLPSPLSDLVEKHLSGQARAFGIEGCGTAVDIVVAGATGRELKLTQTERLVGEKA